ncbi:hypothetical protein ACOSQ3_020142 [Xanthoceras sorbifolium]
MTMIKGKYCNIYSLLSMLKFKFGSAYWFLGGPVCNANSFVGKDRSQQNMPTPVIFPIYLACLLITTCSLYKYKECARYYCHEIGAAHRPTRSTQKVQLKYIHKCTLVYKYMI